MFYLLLERAFLAPDGTAILGEPTVMIFVIVQYRQDLTLDVIDALIPSGELVVILDVDIRIVSGSSVLSSDDTTAAHCRLSRKSVFPWMIAKIDIDHAVLHQIDYFVPAQVSDRFKVNIVTAILNEFLCEIPSFYRIVEYPRRTIAQVISAEEIVIDVVSDEQRTVTKFEEES